MSVLMESLGYQNYNGKWYVRGQHIPVENEGDAEDMASLHLARRVPVPKVDRSMTAETEDSAMAEVEPSKTPEKEAVPPPKRGQYLHRATTRNSR